MTPLILAMSSLGVALGAGLLVGLEREQAAQSHDTARRSGGVRTFGMLGLAGGLSGLLQPALGWWVPGVMAALIAALLTSLMLLEAGESGGRGIVSEVAALAVFLLGLLAALPLDGIEHTQRWGLVAAGAVAVMSLLTFRSPLHALAERVSTRELQATAEVGLLLLVVVPLLPRVELGPWHINPFKTGLLIALIAAMNFAGYLALRTLHTAHRTPIAALLGGMASTTAIARHFGRSVRAATVDPSIAALAVLLATVSMFPRVLLEVALLSPSLVRVAAPVLGSMAGIGVCVAAIAWLRHTDETRKAGAELRIDNPFKLGQVLRFGAIYVVVIVVAGEALERFGASGVMGAALLSGLTDLDAIALAVARLHGDALLSDNTAYRALVLAAGANFLSRAVLAGVFGGWRFGLRVLAWLTPMGVAGWLLVRIVWN